MKKIRISESELKRLIAESVKICLKESSNDVWDLAEKIKECIGADELCNRLIARLDDSYNTLLDIYNVECSNYVDNEEDEEMI